MQQRWERVLNRVEQESATVKDHVRAEAAGMRDAEKAYAPEHTSAREDAAGR